MHYEIAFSFYIYTSIQWIEEGKRKTIRVNVYERNPIARKHCMEHYWPRLVNYARYLRKLFLCTLNKDFVLLAFFVD